MLTIKVNVHDDVMMQESKLWCDNQAYQQVEYTL